MFRWFNKKLKDLSREILLGVFCPKRRARLASSQGQVAVILILIIAFALVFYAVTINLGDIARIKTTTQIASTHGASTLASHVASFGQSLFVQSLGGAHEVCGWTGFLVAIIIVVITYFTAGLGTAFALAVTGAVIQGAIVEPAMTEMYNKITWAEMSTVDRVLESAISTATQAAVTDSVQVVDAYDDNTDGIYGYAADGKPYDEISRFSKYYDYRLDQITTLDKAEIERFINALAEFTFLGNAWRLFDDSGCSSPFAAQCEPCCVPNNFPYPYPFPPGPSNEIISEREAEWYEKYNCSQTPPGYASWEAFCAAGSPYGAAYRWVYDKYHENDTNNATIVSFLELIGRDDQHAGYEVAELGGPATAHVITGPPTEFLLQDAAGYFVDPPFSFPPPPLFALDTRRGIFPYFYKWQDWGVDLRNLDTTTYTEHCYWYDSTRLPGGHICNPTPLGVWPDISPELTKALTLPINPSTLTYDQEARVRNADESVAAPIPLPLAPDKFSLPGNIIANPGECAEEALESNNGFWKKGTDQFCSPDFPYDSGCDPQHIRSPQCLSDGGTEVDCSCEEQDPAKKDLFATDMLDALTYGLQFFAIEWAKVQIERPIQGILNEIKTTWYDEFAEWLEPLGGSRNPGCGTPGNPPCCFECPTDPNEEGFLRVMHREIQEIRDRLTNWRDGIVGGAPGAYVGSDCSEVWCVPNARCGAPPGENATFNLNSNASRGDLEDIIGCLRWNEENTVTYGGVNYTGNAEKFAACHGHCTACAGGDVAACALADQSCCATGNLNCIGENLPRSLVPNPPFDPTSFSLGGNPALLADLLACPADCAAQRAVCDAARAGCVAGCVTVACEDNCNTVDYPNCLLARTCEGFSCNGIEANDPNYLNAIEAAKGSCGDPAWMDNIEKSMFEAKNQLAKFNQRRAFLKSRLDEINAVINIFDTADTKFQEFFDGPVNDLIRFRIEADQDGSTGLPYQLIYGWQDPPTGNRPEPNRTIGYWNIVKVEARVPGRCDNECGHAGGADPGWPKISTRTVSWGMKRCYYMDNTQGYVKFRVTRYEENKEPNVLRFPNGAKIWDFRYNHPNVSDASAANLGWPSGTGSSCGEIVLPPPDIPNKPYILPLDNTTYADNPYFGAFLMSKKEYEKLPNGEDNPYWNEDCWDRVDDILRSGVTTEVCAKYYLHLGVSANLGGLPPTFGPPPPSGFSHKFVDCDELGW